MKVALAVFRIKLPYNIWTRPCSEQNFKYNNMFKNVFVLNVSGILEAVWLVGKKRKYLLFIITDVI